MNEHRYLIEVLLRARESVSQVAQKAAKALDDVTAAQKRNDAATAASGEAARRRVTALEQLIEAHTREKKGLEESTKALRTNANALKEQATAARASLNELQKTASLEKALANEKEKRDIQEVRRLQLEVAEREESTAKKTRAYNAETSQLRKQATLLAALGRDEAAINKRRAAEADLQIAQTRSSVVEQEHAAKVIKDSLDVQEKSINRINREIGSYVKELDKLHESTNTLSSPLGRFDRVMERLGFSTNNARTGLRGLNAEFQGFKIALAIKYAQSLLSALTALAAELIAVAAAAGQAAVGIGAALASGAAQAVPVVGVLAAAFARLTSVLKVVKLRNQEQLTATHNAARAAKAQQTATDQIRSAEERVADAHRNTTRAVEDLSRTRSDAAREEIRAQQDVTKARKDAIRTVEDLKAAEEDAVQTLEHARQSRQRAIESGDISGAVQGEIDVGRARTGLRRARQDAAPARARGVEGIEAVQQAEQRLADTRRQAARTIESAEDRLGDARRNEVQATDDLSRTRQEAKDNVAQETAAVDKLTDSLKQLSPAERDLYRRILVLQETYKRIARPITDIITRAFTDVVDRVNALLRDPRIASGFRNIAVEIARSIRQASGEAGGKGSVSAFQILSAEATRNIPIATRILLSFFRTVRNIVLAAVPAFRLLLSYVEDYSKKAEDASTNSKGLSDFFVTGVQYARSFFELALAVIRLLLAIAGPGGAADEGIRTIDDLTGVVDDLTEKVHDNADSIHDFFDKAHDAFFAVLGVVGNLALAISNVFSERSVTTFADFLNRVIIPALETSVQVMGLLVNLFHQVFSLPGISEVAQMAATILILARGMTVIRLAVGSIAQIIPNFLRAFGLLTEELVGMTAAGEVITATTLTTLGWLVLIIAGVVAAIVLLDKKFHFLAPTFKFLKHVADEVWEGIKSGAEWLADWFSDVWSQGLLYWIRWPFVKAFEFLRDQGVFSWIVNAAKDVIAFFSGEGGGNWAIVRDIITLPFRLAVAPIRVAFRLIRDVIGLAMDLIAGRFDDFGDHMSDFWDDFLDIGKGAISSLLGIIGDLLGALGEIPKIGGPFKAAADDIRDAQASIDNAREADKEAREERKKSDDVIKDAIPNIVKLKEGYDDATDAVKKAKPGTDEYRRSVEKAKEAHQVYNTALHNTAEKSNSARQPVGRLRRNIEHLGDVSHETAAEIADNLNEELLALGEKKLDIRIKRTRRRSAAQNLMDTDNPLLGSSPFPRYMGGIANPYGSPHDDHILYSPGGAAVAAMSGTEGIVNAPQMGVIDSALSFTRAMTGMPWGSLNDLWGSGMRHYARGGKLQLPANFRPTHQTAGLGGYPAIDVFAAPGTQVGSPISGRVVKLSGRSPSAGAYQGAGGPFGLSEYISGGGRTYFLTHFGTRSVRLGQSVRSGQTIGTVGDYPGGVPDHIHEGLRGVMMALQGAMSAQGAAFVPRLHSPRMTGLGTDAISRVVRGVGQTLTRAANRYLVRNVNAFPGGDPSIGDAKAAPPDANVVAAFRRAIRSTSASAKARLALWEAGIVESGLRNLRYGTSDSLGALQERTSIYGRGHALNPFASALRFLRDAGRLQPWRGSAGMLAAAVQRPAAQYRGRYDQVRGQAMRYMRSGGPLTSQTSPRPIGLPGAQSSPIAGFIIRINEFFNDVSEILSRISRKVLGRSKDLALRIERAFEKIAGDNGLLDKMHAQIEAIGTRAARVLQKRQFIVGRRGPRRVTLTDAEVAQSELGTLQQQRGGLQDERELITGGIGKAQTALSVARKRNNKKAIRAAEAALVNLRARLDANASDLAQNAQDQVEAQERFQQGLLDAVTTAAERQDSNIDRWSRMAKALGKNLDPNAVLGAQINNMQQQISGLQGVLAQAKRTGNVALATQVSDQIDELNVSIAESVAQQFQNSIDAVNDTAQKETTRLDRRTRLAQLGGRTDFAAMGNILGDRNTVLTNQRSGLIGLLAQAQNANNVEQVDNLVDQIDELNVQMAENTQAVQDNTDAAFDFRVSQINDAFGFSQSVFQGAQGFFQALTSRTGMDTTTQQLTAMQGIASALKTQQQGLLSSLVDLAGLPGTVKSLTGADLVGYLTSISTGPAFASIMATLDPTQQQSFKDLITALLGNATAVEENTAAVDNLTHPGAQSFSSTLWSTFRSAVFTGAGGLLPQYQAAIPTAAVGARVMRSGMMIVHAGENVRPARVSHVVNGDGGDTYHLNVTTPTEVLNPIDVGRQLAFYRKVSNRR